MTQLGGVIALLTRMGWIEVEDYQHVLKDIEQFLNASIDHRIIGMQLLSVIIQDINSATIPRYSATFRKAGDYIHDLFFFFLKHWISLLI